MNQEQFPTYKSLFPVQTIPAISEIYDGYTKGGYFAGKGLAGALDQVQNVTEALFKIGAVGK